MNNNTSCPWDTADHTVILMFHGHDWYEAGIGAELAMKREKSRLAALHIDTSMTLRDTGSCASGVYGFFAGPNVIGDMYQKPALHLSEYYRVTPQNCHHSLLAPVKTRKGK